MLSLFNIRNKPVFVNQVPVHMGRVRYASPRIKGSAIAPRQKEAMFATAETGVFSQIELAMIRNRVRSGMASAKAKGKQIGRPQVTADSIPAFLPPLLSRFQKRAVECVRVGPGVRHQQNHDLQVYWTFGSIRIFQCPLSSGTGLCYNQFNKSEFDELFCMIVLFQS